MYQLMVSRNCGISYYPEAEAETLDELQPTIERISDTPFRWVVEEDGQMLAYPVCWTFQEIIGFMDEVSDD